MNINDLLVGGLKQSLEMLKMTLADMTDAELMQRPVPTANHANWQIGHIIASETRMMSGSGAKMPELPAGFAEKYTKETVTVDDAAKFATKAELLAQFEKTRAASMAWVKGLSAAQLDAPSSFPEMCPNVAALASLASGHIFMHMGQIQVLRRKLGKPILF